MAEKQSEKRYRAIVENQTEMICCFQADGTITFINDAYCRFFNKNREELIGHKFFPLIPDDDREKVFESISNLNPNKPIVTLEHRVLAPSGEVCWHRWTNRAIFDDQNKLKEYQAVGWNVTELRQSEEALKKSEEKYRRLFEMESDAMFLIRKNDGQILEVNTAGTKLYGYTREELLRKKNIDLSAEPDVTRKATMEQKREIPVRYHRKKNGTVFPVEITASHFTWIGQEVHIAAIRDITKRKQAEEALRKAHDELEQRVEERTKELEIRTRSLAELNMALKILLEKRKEDRILLEDNVMINIKKLIEPLFDKMRETELDEHQKVILSIMESNLNEITSPLLGELSLKHLNLTPTEIKIVNMIKHGTTTKKIAKFMNSSPRTIETHRKNIRRKIGLDKKKGNLRSYLLSIS